MKFKDNIGFTLIELLVVVAIIGILAAVGIVSYSGFTNAAKKNVAIANYNSMVKWITMQSGFCEIDSNYNVAVLTWPDCKTKQILHVSRCLLICNMPLNILIGNLHV
jgi:prepilin-type N-terminal cleavage/methylation domain-containing protein